MFRFPAFEVHARASPLNTIFHRYEWQVIQTFMWIAFFVLIDFFFFVSMTSRQCYQFSIASWTTWQPIYVCLSFIALIYLVNKFVSSTFRAGVMCHSSPIGNLSTRVFETRTATGREHSVCQDSGVSHIFIVIIQNREMVLSIVNVMVWRRAIRENSSLPLAVRVSKSRVLKLPINVKKPLQLRSWSLLMLPFALMLHCVVIEWTEVFQGFLITEHVLLLKKKTKGLIVRKKYGTTQKMVTDAL